MINIGLLVTWLKAAGWPLAKTVGQAVGAVLLQLLTGKALKQAVVNILEWASNKTKTKQDDKIVDKAKEDLGLDNKKEK